MLQVHSGSGAAAAAPSVTLQLTSAVPAALRLLAASGFGHPARIPSVTVASGYRAVQ